MPDVQRCRGGSTRPIRQAFKTGIAVSIGDHVYEDAADGFTLKPASALPWPAAVAASAPTVTSGGVAVGTALANAATGVKVSYQFPWGEGALSPAASVTPGAGDAIRLSGVAVPAPVVALNVYVESSAGSGTYQLYALYPALGGGLGIGDQMLFGYGTGHAPYAGNAGGVAVPSDATAIAQYAVAAAFVGVSAQRYNGIAPTYGVLDGKLRVDTAGVFDFTCAAASFNPGDLIGPAQGSGNALDSQAAVAVVHTTLAVAVVQMPASNATTVRGQVISRKATMSL